MDMPSNFLVITPNDWPEAKRIAEQIEPFNMYRGQSDASWGLASNFERIANRFQLKNKDKRRREQKIINLFKARAHNYISSPPNKLEYIEWLSLIQDYGGPTRLLDFTRSFYIAAFFAIESATGPSSIWVIDEIRLLDAITHNDQRMKIAKLKHDKEYFFPPIELTRFAEEYIKDPDKSDDVVVQVVPPRLNERLAVQQGLFLFPCNIETTFENNLCKSFKLPFDNLKTENAIQLTASEFFDLYKSIEIKSKSQALVPTRALPPIIKINLKENLRIPAITDLHTMNIDYASLFPGLDGFAKSLSYHLLYSRKTLSSFITTLTDPEEIARNL
jgi:hypothetical protein